MTRSTRYAVSSRPPTHARCAAIKDGILMLRGVISAPHITRHAPSVVVTNMLRVIRSGQVEG